MTAVAADAALAPKASASSKVAKPRIIAQPHATSAVSGKKATFTVKAKGKHLTYRWYVLKNGARTWKKAAGSTAKKRTYVVRAAAGLDRSGYRVVITGDGGSVTSRSRVLTVISKPKITSGPVPVRTEAGTKAVFAVAAKGNKLKYSWQTRTTSSASWTTLPGKTSARLTITAHTAAGGSKYRVVVSNSQGKSTSSEAGLYVDSTRSDPFALGQTAILNDWGVKVTYNDFVDLEDGTYGMLSVVVACYYGDEGSAVPWLDLDLTYVGTDGASHDNDGIYVDGDIWDTDRVYKGGCASFVGVAIVPSWAAPGGVWSVRDTSDRSNTVEGFFKGL